MDGDYRSKEFNDVDIPTAGDAAHHEASPAAGPPAVWRSGLVGALVMLNLVLLMTLWSAAVGPNRAQAQPAGRAGDFACVTAKAAGQSYDVVYLLDRGQKRLHAFTTPNISTRKLSYASFRDLEADFGK